MSSAAPPAARAITRQSRLAFARAAYRRAWAASVAVVLFVLLAATARYLLAPRSYIASAVLRIVVTHADAGTPAGGNAAQADAVAHTLTSSTFLASPTLASAVHTQLGSQAQPGMTTTALQRSLSASDLGDAIILTAQWSTAQGAEDLLTAALGSLGHDPAILQQLASPSVRLQAAFPTAATRLPGEEDDLRATLLTRVVLALLAAALLPLALAALPLPSHREE